MPMEKILREQGLPGWNSMAQLIGGPQNTLPGDPALCLPLQGGQIGSRKHLFSPSLGSDKSPAIVIIL